jgi:hypothetical protein
MTARRQLILNAEFNAGALVNDRQQMVYECANAV